MRAWTLLPLERVRQQPQEIRAVFHVNVERGCGNYVISEEVMLAENSLKGQIFHDIESANDSMLGIDPSS